MKVIRSLYRDSAKDQFEMEIVGEGIDDEFNEPCYLCKFLPKWQNQFQNGYGIHQIRKCLIGEDNLYTIIDREDYYEQLSLF